MKENEFTRIKTEQENLVCLAKSRYIKFMFYYMIFSSKQEMEIEIPVKEIREMRIYKVGLFWLFPIIAFAIASIGIGALNNTDQDTGEKIYATTGQTITGIIFCIIFLLIGFFILRSKWGRLKIIQTTYKGCPLVLYASTDMEELRSLRKLIQDDITN